MGVELVGRWAAVRDGRALFSGGLRNVFSLADLKMERLLDTFDEWAQTNGHDAEVGPPERFAPTRVPESTRLQLDLRSGEIRTIVWATGFRPDYGWLDVPVVDAKGQLRHEGGVVDSPGLYALGLPVLRRRKSTFIYGMMTMRAAHRHTRHDVRTGERPAALLRDARYWAGHLSCSTVAC